MKDYAKIGASHLRKARISFLIVAIAGAAGIVTTLKYGLPTVSYVCGILAGAFLMRAIYESYFLAATKAKNFEAMRDVGNDSLTELMRLRFNIK